VLRMECDTPGCEILLAMSDKDVDVVRLIYSEGLLARDPKRLLGEFASPDIEYVDPPNEVDGGSRHGRNEVLLALRRNRQSFSVFEHELDEVFDAGETVIAAVTFRATVRRSTKNDEIEEVEAHVWTFRDGQVIRLETGRDLDEALAAAGLSK
jgi:ketosteroid isomerase-like protein